MCYFYVFIVMFVFSLMCYTGIVFLGPISFLVYLFVLVLVGPVFD